MMVHGKTTTMLIKTRNSANVSDHNLAKVVNSMKIEYLLIRI